MNSTSFRRNPKIDRQRIDGYATRYYSTVRLTFVYTKQFLASAEAVLTEPAFRVLEHMLLQRPDAGDVVAGTGGVRKVRVPLPGRGKSGGARVRYYYAASRQRVYLLLVYPKNVAVTISEAGKKELRKWIAKLE